VRRLSTVPLPPTTPPLLMPRLPLPIPPPMRREAEQAPGESPVEKNLVFGGHTFGSMCVASDFPSSRLVRLDTNGSRTARTRPTTAVDDTSASSVACVSRTQVSLGGLIVGYPNGMLGVKQRQRTFGCDQIRGRDLPNWELNRWRTGEVYRLHASTGGAERHIRCSRPANNLYRLSPIRS